MYVYQSTNFCHCRTSTPPTVDPECPDDCNCLKVCDIRINASDSRAVGPCAKNGTLNVMASEFGHDFCACGEMTPSWTVQSIDTEIFITAAITRAGILTWKTQGPEALDKAYGEIILKVCCGALSYYVRVLIGVKDLCNCPDCNDCENCDPCTGNCEDVEIDLFFQTVPVSGNTSLNAS